MIPLEVRFEDVSGKASIIVTANLAESWRPLANHCGFYGFAHEKYLESGLITIRVWVVETPAQGTRAQEGFPLDLQSMGTSPSRALAFRLFNGRLSVGAALNTVINSRRGDGSPGYYKEAVLLAQHAGVSYWLRFYAALNDEHPEMPEWTEQDIPLAEEATLPRVTDIRDLRASNIEDRLSRVSMALDTLEERASTLVRTWHEEGAAASQGKELNRAADLEKTAQELKAQWSREFEKQAESALEKLREVENKSSRAFEETQQQLASLAETKLASLYRATASATAGLEATAAKLREEISDSRRAIAEHQQQLGSLAEARLVSPDRLETGAVAGLETVMAKLREEVSNSGQAFAESKRQLASLADEKLTSLNQAAASATAGLEAAAAKIDLATANSLRSLEATAAKLQEESSESRRAIAEHRQQLASLAEARLASPDRPETGAVAGLESAMAKLREEVSDSGRALAASKRELVSLAEARLTTIDLAAANAKKSLEAATAKLLEEVSNSGQAFAESKRQLASLADAKLASLNQAAASATAGLEAAAAKIDLATANAMKSLEAATARLREEVGNSGQAFAESKRQLASLADAKQASLSQAAASAAADLEAAVAKLREEVGNSGRRLADSRREASGPIETRSGFFNQAGPSPAPDLEPEQRRFPSQYVTSRKEIREPFTRRPAEQPSALADQVTPSNRRGVVVMLTLAAGLFLVATIPPWGEYLSSPPPVQMHLQTQAPADFADQSPYWSAKRRIKEEETALAYWRVAAFSLQIRYPYGSQLPADPPPEFQVDTQDVPTGNAAAVKETRARYWEKLRAYWGQRRFWIESQPEEETWTTRMQRAWEQFKAKLG